MNAYMPIKSIKLHGIYGWGWSKSRLLQLIDGSVKLAIHDKLTESDQATSYVFLDNDIFTLKTVHDEGLPPAKFSTQ